MQLFLTIFHDGVSLACSTSDGTTNQFGPLIILVRDCQFGVSPVNYSDSENSIVLSNIRVFFIRSE